MNVQNSRSDKIFLSINYILATFFLIVCLYPLFFVLIASFSNPSLVTTGQVWILPRGMTLEGYRRMLENSDIWIGYRNTIFYTAVGTFINLAFTLTAGYVLSRVTLPGRRLINLIFMLTMFINGGLVPTYLLVRSLHLENTFWIMVLMGAVNVWDLIICRTFFSSNIPLEMLEAAQIDGCDDFRFFFTIVLPLSGAIIAVLTLFFAVGHWNGYYTALIYLRDKNRYPLQLVLRNILLASSLNVNEDAGMGQLLKIQSMKYGVIIVASVPVLILYPFIQKHFVKGVMVGAIKG